MKLLKGSVSYALNDVPRENDFSIDAAGTMEGITIDIKSESILNGTRITLDITAGSETTLIDLHLQCSADIEKEEKIYCNGYQSWTDSREFGTGERMKKLAPIMHLIKMNWYGDYHMYNYSGKPGMLHGYTYSYIRKKNNSIDFMGSLDESRGYTIFEFNASQNTVNIKKECSGMDIAGKERIIDLVLLDGNERDLMGQYFSMMDLPSTPEPLCSGWTSWYNYYTNISEEIILENLAAFQNNNIPIDTFQIDDGYQTAVGDWLSLKPSFPNGMKKIAGAVNRAGFKAGLWLAPFACEKKSAIYKSRKDWLVKDSAGSPVPAGWNPSWSGNFYCLDIYNDDVRDYLKDVFTTVLDDWGFDMVKLDFLYAAAQVPRNGKSRGEIMRDAMVFLRECVGKKIILGCGVPLGPAFGLVDYCRIGSDVALKWEDWLLSRVNYRERVSTINSLYSTIGRRHLNTQAFVNDPDVVILREENNNLTMDQKFTLFILNNLFGGLVFTSDNISLYSGETMRLYKSMFPMRKKEDITVFSDKDLYTITFKISGRHYTVIANLSASTRSYETGNGNYFSTDHSTGEGSVIKAHEALSLRPYQSLCLLSIAEEPLAIAGSTGHIFPGSDIENISATGNKITVNFHGDAKNRGPVYITASDDAEYIVNGTQCSVEKFAATRLIKAFNIT